MRNGEPHWHWWRLVLLLPLLAIVLIGLAAWFVVAVVLLLTVWLVWGPRGRRALIVYSNSPVWRQYFKDHILPPLSERSVVLNWSERKHWRWSLAVALFWCFSGSREFNPLAVVFRPFALPRWFRFYKPFKAFKQGRAEQVERTRRDLFHALAVADLTSTSPPSQSRP